MMKLIIVLLIISVIGIATGMFYFMLGFKNLDMGWNILLLNEKLDINLIDNGGNLIRLFEGENVKYTGEELVSLGYSYSVIGLILSSFSWLVFGVCIGRVEK